MKRGLLVVPRRSFADDDDAPPIADPSVRGGLIDSTFLFRFETQVLHEDFDPKADSWPLGAEYRIPTFGTLVGRPRFADVRMAWSPNGIVFWIQATGKRQLPWCRDARAEDSDGFHVWIDTRNSLDIHRATRFCHHFVFAPMGAGAKRDRPFCAMVPIGRAREQPNPMLPNSIRAWSKLHSNGYMLSGLISAQALTGFDPREYSQISFWWAVVDRELGWQTMTLGPEYPVTENPSLWSVAALVPPA